MSVEVEELIATYLNSPKDDSAGIAANIVKWFAIANDPAKFYPDAGLYELRSRRRCARQNTRRLLVKHPELAPMVAKLMEAQ